MEFSNTGQRRPSGQQCRPHCPCRLRWRHALRDSRTRGLVVGRGAYAVPSTIWTVPCVRFAGSPPIPRPNPSWFVLTLDPAISVPARQLPRLGIPLHLPTGTEQYQSQPCPAGHFCPAGTRSPRPCPAGTFRSSRQAGAAAECLPCPADTFGALPGQTGCLPCGSFAFSPQGGSHPHPPPLAHHPCPQVLSPRAPGLLGPATVRAGGAGLQRTASSSNVAARM